MLEKDDDEDVKKDAKPSIALNLNGLKDLAKEN
jgi:hypothetical protein